ncbi:histidine kinase dimerization/phospho-acceptor domain-containing protein, partial [Chloroflexota bacterium]
MADLLILFIMPPGNLLYFLAIIAVSQAALYIALEHGLRDPSQAAIRRYSQASLGIMFGWLILGLGAIVGMFTAQPTNNILPPLEHTVNTLVIILAGWAFLTAESPTSNRLWDVITVALVGLTAIGGIFTLTQWLPLAALVDFNSTLYALAWTFIPLVLCLFLLLILLYRIRTIPDVPLKMVFFAILIAGYGVSAFRVANNSLLGDYVSVIRAAFLLAMPFYVLVLYRYVTHQLTTAAAGPPAAQPATSPTPKTGRPQVSATPIERESVQLLRALGDMLDSSNPGDLPQQITIATANALKADIVALGQVKDANWVDIVASYDNIQQKPTSGMAINLDQQPTLTTVIERAAQRPLHPDTNIEELVDLYTRLDIIQSGPLGTAYFQPLKQNNQTFAVLIILFPYTGRELKDSETALLEGMAPIAGKLLGLGEHAVSSPPLPVMGEPSPAGDMPAMDYSAAIKARQEMQNSLEMAHAQTNQLSQVIQTLKSELESERHRIVEVLATDEETLSISQQIMALGEETTQLETQRDELANELQEAQTMLVGATASGNNDMYHTMIDILSREQQTLAAQKANLEQQLHTLREQTNDMFLVPASIQETMQALNQEKGRLISERDSIAAELQDVKSELDLLGVEGGVAGLALVLGQLYEERDQLKAQLQQAPSAAAAAALPQDVGIAALQEELARLAADREAAFKQRDALRHEQVTWNKERSEWQQQRQRLGQQISGIQQSIRDNSEQREQLLQERNTLAEERSNLIEERDRLLASSTALQTERDQLSAQITGDRELLQQLGADGIDALKAMIDDLTAERSTLEHQILQTQADLDLMEGKLQAYEQSALAATPRPQPAIQIENPEVLLSIAQELRTPMSSITGYTDLLLGESVGILGALQRKFLQRVKANIERLSSLVEDMISVIALDSGQLNLEPEPVNVLDLLDDIITNASTQFREKEITLNL